MWVRSLGWEDPLEEEMAIHSSKWQSTPVFLPGESHGQRNLAGYNPWGHKELGMTEHAHMAESQAGITFSDF